jgi:hypothetical protein
MEAGIKFEFTKQNMCIKITNKVGFLFKALKFFYLKQSSQIS